METPSWKRVVARTGRFDYQFQGAGPAVRNGRYEEARDFQFLVLDAENRLYRIPVFVPAEVAQQVTLRAEGEAAPEGAIRELAEAALCAGLDNFRPRENTPYAELDHYFALTLERAAALAKQEDRG
jgi:hypothetical protein